jgi:hypothetical protein
MANAEQALPRAFDLILYGASGFTGRLVAEHLLRARGFNGPAPFNLDGGLSTRQVIVEAILPATWQAACRLAGCSRLGAQSRRCPAPCQRGSFPKLR